MIEQYTQDGFYTHPQETWTVKQCEKMIKQRLYGGPKGMVCADSSPYVNYGSCVRFNGGCVREGKWYPGEQKPLPILPEGYEFYRVTSWGLFIQKTSK